MRLFSWLLVSVVGCGPDKSPPAATTPSSEGDADTDTDADTDVDLDSAADSGTPATDTASDTGSTDPGLVTGEWVGDCTDPLSVETYISGLGLDLRLVEAAGVVTGKGKLTVSEGDTVSTYTTSVQIALQGTFDGVSALEVDLAQDYGTYASPLDIALTGTIADDTWTATFASTVDTTHGVFDCVLERH